MQLQCRISQRIGNSISSKLWADGTHNHSLGGSALNNEPSDHHVIPSLHTAAKLRPASCKTNVRPFSIISFAKNARLVLASGEATDKEFRCPGFQIQQLE